MLNPSTKQSPTYKRGVRSVSSAASLMPSRIVLKPRLLFVAAAEARTVGRTALKALRAPPTRAAGARTLRREDAMDAIVLF
jgi:hypothetical protein